MIDYDSKKDVKWWNSKWLAGKYFSSSFPSHLHGRNFQFIPAGNENFPLAQVIMLKF